MNYMLGAAMWIAISAADPSLVVEQGKHDLIIRRVSDQALIVSGKSLGFGTFELLIDLDGNGVPEFRIGPLMDIKATNAHWTDLEMNMKMWKWKTLSLFPTETTGDGLPPSAVVSRAPQDRIRIELDLNRDGVEEADVVAPFGW